MPQIVVLGQEARLGDSVQMALGKLRQKTSRRPLADSAGQQISPPPQILALPCPCQKAEPAEGDHRKGWPKWVCKAHGLGDRRRRPRPRLPVLWGPQTDSPPHTLTSAMVPPQPLSLLARKGLFLSSRPLACAWEASHGSFPRRTPQRAAENSLPSSVRPLGLQAG